MKMRLIALLLLLLLPLSLLTSCGGRRAVTEEELFPAVRELLTRSVLVNTVFLGDGIPVTGMGFEEYFFADEAWMAQHGLYTVESLRALAASVYSTPVCEILYHSAFTTDDTTLADYRDRAAPGYGLLVLATRKGIYRSTTHEYLFDTMTLTAATANTATVTLTVRVTPEGMPPRDHSFSLPLVKGADGSWRCDKLTCISYEAMQE